MNNTNQQSVGAKCFRPQESRTSPYRGIRQQALHLPEPFDSVYELMYPFYYLLTTDSHE
jgi:hypothetical protein